MHEVTKGEALAHVLPASVRVGHWQWAPAPPASLVMLLPDAQEDAKKLKSKQRSKMQPKMGKLGMDYQMMHEAFFKYQSKPHLTRIGDLYYEGKEFEARVSWTPPCRSQTSVPLFCHLDLASLPQAALQLVAWSLCRAQRS